MFKRLPLALSGWLRPAGLLQQITRGSTFIVAVHALHNSSVGRDDWRCSPPVKSPNPVPFPPSHPSVALHSPAQAAASVNGSPQLDRAAGALPPLPLPPLPHPHGPHPHSCPSPSPPPASPGDWGCGGLPDAPVCPVACYHRFQRGCDGSKRE